MSWTLSLRVLAVVLSIAGVVRAGEDGEAGEPLGIDFTPDEREFVDSFSRAYQGFKEMSLGEFLDRYGPAEKLLEGSFTRGDANFDRRVDLTDAICILYYLFGGASGEPGSCSSPLCPDALDGDDSGGIDLTDAISLLQYLFLGGPEPTTPFSAPGHDPSGDGLACDPSVGGRLGYEPLQAEYLDRIYNAYPLSLAQEDLFRENGFVIYKNVEFESMLLGYFEVYRRHLPVYITVDSILDALHLSFDRVLILLEEGTLKGELEAMLERMESGIDALRGRAPGIDIERELDDVALWVCVARSFLSGSTGPCARGVDAAAGEILTLAAAESIADVALFGLDERIDFSQFRPRGHYSRSESLARYFRAMQWVQMTGLEFVRSRRHAAVAVLLTHLIEDTGAITHWRKLSDSIHALVGFSESLTASGLKGFLAEKGFSLPDFYDVSRYGAFRRAAFDSALGRQEISSQIIDSGSPLSLEGFRLLQPTFQVFGQRFLVDRHLFTNLVQDRACPTGCPAPCPLECGRPMPSPLDAWFVLGNRATVPLLLEGIERWEYHPNLAALDRLVASYSPHFWSDNLYNVWLSALRQLSMETTESKYPSVMRTDEWGLRILQAQLGSWTQLRSDFILHSKPSQNPQGCFYPDGWVDPYPRFYETLAAFADQALGVFQDVAAQDSGVTEYFSNLATVCTELAGIARAELEGADMTSTQSDFIQKWLSQRGKCGGEGPIDRPEPFFFDGWYPKLIFQIPVDVGEGFHPTVADVHTKSSPEPMEVLHVGVGYPNLMLISVQNECGLRSYAGPVSSYHEFTVEGPNRLTEDEWKNQLELGGEERPAWTRAIVR